MTDLGNRIKDCFFRRLSHLHSRKWEEIEQVLGSKGRLRLCLYLASCGPVSKSTLVDHFMKSGRYADRESCTRAVNRLLGKMIEEDIVKVDEEGAVQLQRGRLTVGEYPGIWIALGPGASLVFLDWATWRTIASLSFVHSHSCSIQ